MKWSEKSWKTSVWGLVLLACFVLPELIDLPPETKGYIRIVIGAAFAALGISARDNNRTSEQVGADDRQNRIGR